MNQYQIYIFLKAVCPFEEKNDPVGSTLKKIYVTLSQSNHGGGVTFSESIYPTQGRNVNWWRLGALAKARVEFRVICAKSQADLSLEDNLENTIWQQGWKTSSQK